MTLLPDGTYDIVEQGCMGTSGSAAGRWKPKGNVIEFAPSFGNGHVFSQLSWALATEEEGCVTMTTNGMFEIYLDNGYSVAWSLTKKDDVKKIHTAMNRRTTD